MTGIRNNLGTARLLPHQAGYCCCLCQRPMVGACTVQLHIRCRYNSKTMLGKKIFAWQVVACCADTDAPHAAHLVSHGRPSTASFRGAS